MNELIPKTFEISLYHFAFFGFVGGVIGGWLLSFDFLYMLFDKGTISDRNSPASKVSSRLAMAGLTFLSGGMTGGIAAFGLYGFVAYPAGVDTYKVLAQLIFVSSVAALLRSKVTDKDTIKTFVAKWLGVKPENQK